MDTTTDLSAARRGRLARARMAVSVVFLVPGAAAGLWAVHIPLIATRLAIDPGVIGLALLAMAIGAVVTMPLTGVLLGRFGTRRPTAAFALIFSAIFPFAILAPSTPLLFVGAFLFGSAMGAVDVSMNMQAAEIEEARGRPTMSSFHGFFSLGTLVGSALGGLIIAVGLGNGGGAVLTAIALFIASIWAGLNLWQSDAPAHEGPRFALPPLALLGIGAIPFLSFAAEGAVTDWSALYLATVKMSGVAAAASGVVTFSIAMVIFRLTGDWVVARLGGVATVVGGGLLVAAGMGLAIVTPSFVVAAIGFAIVGVGAANLVPVAISAASRIKGIQPGLAVAAATSMGYAGFLIFPPVLGFVARGFGLSVSLLIVVVMGLAMAALGVSVRRK